MKRIIFSTFALLFALILTVSAQEPLKVIIIGAHPDDCEFRASGTAALYVQMGHKVKFVSLTNGNRGHYEMESAALAARRKGEFEESARRLGLVCEVLDNPDGELQPTLENRMKVLSLIRDWGADVVITHRLNDYHPDHRYTSQIVQDAAYMVGVPLMDKATQPLGKNPLFVYMQDAFQRPNPFRPDIVVDITSTYEKKLDALDAHVSQVYEWLPWIDKFPIPVPTSPQERRSKFIYEYVGRRDYMNNEMVAKLTEQVGWERASQIRKAEAFEICEYGLKPTKEDIVRLFPMIK